jgi:hypothetical protein
MPKQSSNRDRRRQVPRKSRRAVWAAISVAPGAGLCAWGFTWLVLGMDVGLALGWIPGALTGGIVGALGYIAIESSRHANRTRMAIGTAIVANLLFLGLLILMVRALTQA